jgi:hypothetical protein
MSVDGLGAAGPLQPRRGVEGATGVGGAAGASDVSGIAGVGGAEGVSSAAGASAASAASGVGGASSVSAAVLNRMQEIAGRARSAGRSEEQVIDEVVGDVLSPFRGRRDFDEFRAAVTRYVLADPILRGELTAILRPR